MTSLRKVLVFLTAAMLTAFTLPAYAVDKLFSISTTNLTLPISAPIGYTVTWNNAPGNSGGNSVINSVKLDIPAGVQFKIMRWTINNPGASAVVGGGTAYVPYPTAVALNTAIGPFPSPVQIAIKDFTGAKPGGTFVLNLTIISAGASNCAIIAKGYGWSGNTWGGVQFVPSPAGSDVEVGFACTLGCDFTNNTNTKGGNLDPTADLTYGLPGGETPDWGLIRGPNRDGGACTAVPYVFNFDPVNHTASFIVPNKLGQQLLVEYILVWSPTPWAATHQLNLAWGPGLNSPPTPGIIDSTGVPQFTPGLPCSNDDVSGASGSPLPIIPNVAPFTFWSPYTQYKPTTTALMCIAQSGFTAVSTGFVQYWDKVMDADGFVGGWQ